MQLIQKLNAFLRLIRPELPISAGICVVVGQSIALGRFPPLANALLGFALGLFLSSSAMIFNDVFDLEVDRINSPQRPLPAGLLTKTEAAIFGIITALVAWAVALAIHPTELILSLFLWVLGFLYNWKLKSAGVWGNLIVSTNVAMTFILGGISVGETFNPMVWIFGLIAFAFDLAEEIAGDAMDMEGDQKRGSKSIAIRYGKSTALRVSGVLFVLVIALTFVPVWLGETGLEYILPIALMDILILIFTRKLWKSQTPQAGRQAMRTMYLSATLGLVAFILARILG